MLSLRSYLGFADMVALVDVVQVADRLQKVADVGVSALQSTLPALQSGGREALRRSIAEAGAAAQRSAPTSMAVGSDIGLDMAVAKVDPTTSLDPTSFTVDGAHTHPWIKEDLAHLSHAATEKDRHDREHGRGSHQPFINPIPKDGILPWANPEPPKMREGARMQSRHPMMKF
jgi:hypothetical protein